jgi:signal transduction histidine kinase
MILGTTALVSVLALAQLVIVAALGGAVLRLRQAVQARERAASLGEGAALIVEDGVVVDASEEAEALLARGSSLRGRRVREVLEDFLDCCQGDASAALDRLAATGEAIELLVGDRQGRPYALSGAPRGGQLRLALREVAFLDADLSRAQSEVAAREASLVRREEAVRALAGLIAAAPLVAWSRSPDGTVRWTAGRIVTPRGVVEAAQVAALAAARPRPVAAPGEGGPEHFRLELAPQGSETVALEAIEVPAEGGGRHGLAVDASGALEAERSLARFVRTMTETFAHLNVGLAIFDHDQRLALFNPALVGMWQADPAWLARRPSLREILDRLRANRRIPETADFRAWRGRLTGLFENTEAAAYDELWHLADGSDIRVLARPHPHGSLAFVFEDVTERLRLEQQYRHSIDLRRATLDRLDEGLAVFGPDGLLQFVNAAFHDIWGTDEESVRPLMHVRELMPLVSGLTVETEVWRRLTAFITSADSRQPWSARLTLGTGRILSARFAGLPDGSTMAVFGDVTDSERIALALRERNEALEAAEEMRGAVLDQISHRLRTPLHTIFGFGQLMVDPRFGSLTETQRGYAEQILESARHLLGAVDDVTELAALDIEPPGERGADASLADTLRLAARLLEKRATEAGVTLVLALPEADAVAACEPARLRQIVFSLATAAIGSCREGSEVELGAGPGDGRTVEVHVVTTPRDDNKGVCPSLPFIRRLAAQAGGAIEVFARDGTGRVKAVCRLPLLAGAAPAGMLSP